MFEASEFAEGSEIMLHFKVQMSSEDVKKNLKLMYEMYKWEKGQKNGAQFTMSSSERINPRL